MSYKFNNILYEVYQKCHEIYLNHIKIDII